MSAIAARLSLGYYLMEAGDSDRARSILRSVADGGGQLQARALLDLAGLDYWGEGSVPAVARCEEALSAAAGDAALEAACHAELAVYCDNDSARSERHARYALDLLDAAGEAADPDVLVDALLATTRARLVMGTGCPADLIERAFEAEARAATSIFRSRVGSQLGQWLKYVDDFAGARARLEDAQSQAMQEGDESSLPESAHAPRAARMLERQLAARGALRRGELRARRAARPELRRAARDARADRRAPRQQRARPRHHRRVPGAVRRGAVGTAALPACARLPRALAGSCSRRRAAPRRARSRRRRASASANQASTECTPT